jgi:alkanesulfonate monooxygenase SsuD/methylene tetrahydromethanopterin reductase-like flavin-dependent oxidoreductase (luciferase family)
MLTDMSGSDAMYCASRAEEKGLESVWVPEMTRRDSVSILGGIASSTKRIHLAPGILNVYSRTPALIAMTLASLQEMSNGRLIAGLSSGNPDTIRNVHGLNYKDSIERLREVVGIIRMVASGNERLEVSGKIFNIKNWSPKFPKLSPIPIYVGAHNPKLLQFIGESCDGVILNLVSSENVRSAIRIISDSASSCGRDPKSIDIASIVMVSIDDDAKVAEERVRKQIAFYLARSRQIRKRFSKSEFAEDVSKVNDALAKGREGEIARNLSQDLVDSVGIYGSKEEVEERIYEYEKAGLNLAILYIAGWMNDARSITDNLLGRINL